MCQSGALVGLVPFSWYSLTLTLGERRLCTVNKGCLLFCLLNTKLKPNRDPKGVKVPSPSRPWTHTPN